MNLRPLGDRVVIKKMEPKEETKSGIVLTGSQQEEPQIAEILAIGSGILEDEKRKDDIKVGDKVVFSEYAGNEVKLEDEEYTILKLNDILAVIE